MLTTCGGMATNAARPDPVGRPRHRDLDRGGVGVGRDAGGANRTLLSIRFVAACDDFSFPVDQGWSAGRRWCYEDSCARDFSRRGGRS